MQRLKELIKSLKTFEKLLLKEVEKVIRDNMEIVVEMNSEDQLFEQGIDRHGQKIADYAPYSAVTVQIKREKGQPTNRVTLRDEGDFHFSFFIEFSSTGFEIRADDGKTKKLLKGYGEGILGLTEENITDLAQNYILPELIKLFKTI